MPNWSDPKLARGAMTYFSGVDELQINKRGPRRKFHDETTPRKHSTRPDDGLLPYLKGSHEMYDRHYMSRLPIHGKTKPKNHRDKYTPDRRHKAAQPPSVPRSMHAQVDPRQQHHRNQMPQPSAAPTYAPFPQDISGQYMDTYEGMGPGGGQQQQHRYHSQRRHRGYQGSMDGSEMDGSEMDGSEMGEDEDAYESEARGYTGPYLGREENFTQGREYPPPNGQYRSSAPQHESMSPAAGMYGRPRPPIATFPMDNMRAEARAGTPRSQRSRGPPSQSMNPREGTPLVQEMGNMSLGPYLGTPSAPGGPPQNHLLRRTPRPYAMQPNPSISMDHHAGRRTPPLDPQFPGTYDDGILAHNTPSLSTGYWDSAHGTPVPESPGPMNMPQPHKQYYAPQPRVPVPPRMLSDDELGLRYDSDVSSPEMRSGPRGTFSPRYNPSREEY